MASSLSGFPKEGWTRFQIPWAWVEGSGKTPAATSHVNLCSSDLKMQRETWARAETENSSRVSHQSGFSGHTILVYQNSGARQQMWDVRMISEIRRHKRFKFTALTFTVHLRSSQHPCSFPRPQEAEEVTTQTTATFGARLLKEMNATSSSCT